MVDRQSWFKQRMRVWKNSIYSIRPGELKQLVTPLSRPFKTKQLTEKEHSKYPEQERKKIGVGVVRIKS
jgi:hypothetical protein